MASTETSVLTMGCEDRGAVWAPGLTCVLGRRSCVDPRAHLCTPGLEPTQLQLKLKVERPILQGGVDTGKQS